MPGKAPGEVLCKLWARGGERLCASRSCPYRHRFATEAERVWSEGAKARRLKEMRREADDRDPWVDRDEAVIMVGTLADEHEVPNHNHTLFPQFPRPIRHFQPCPQVAKWCQNVSNRECF